MLKAMPYQSPESLGISSNAIGQFLDCAQKEQFGLHSVILIRHGKTALECYFKPYAENQVHILYSLSKSFTSTAVGFAVQEGLLTIEDRVMDFFPDILPCEPCGYMKQVKLRHLLCMASGHSEEPPAFEGENWVYNFLTSYIDKEPGSIFTYNTAATYMISAILQKVTGQRVLEYLRPRLFEPLGFSDKTWWEKSPEGIDCGGFGLNVTARDLAKFGQFYLQRGKWNGKQLLNADWIDLATSKQIDNYGELDWGCGYGFQFWRCQPEGVYRGDGAFGQYCIVMPKQDAVIVINSSVVGSMQKTLDAVWNILLPAMKDEPLAEDIRAEQKLLTLCKNLQVPVSYRFRTPKIDVNGITFCLSENPLHLTKCTPHFGKRKDVILFEGAHGTLECTVHSGTFTANTLPAYEPDTNGIGDQIAALYLDRSAAGGWIDDTTYRLYLYGTYDTTADILELKFYLERRCMEIHFTCAGSFDSDNTTVFGIA